MAGDAEGKQLKILKDILQTLQEHRETIDYLRNQVASQNERIKEQEKTISSLTSRVDDLSSKATSIENGESIWKDSSTLSIAEAVKETAEKALLTNLGFVYVPSSKLYCNYTTGYYYDPVQALFYNGHTGTYYTYDSHKQKYVFHSQLELEAPSFVATTNVDGQKKDKYSKIKRKPIDESVQPIGDVEDGELSSSDKSDTEYDSSGDEISSEVDEELSPCIRAMVMESSSSSIKRGSLFIITCMGGSIGSEGDQHVITLPDPSVDKVHAYITYSLSTPEDIKGKKKYYLSDMGSSTGTTLNGVRLSNDVQNSSVQEIVHGSVVKIGNFSILMHIHAGNFTCGHCEPGLVMNMEELEKEEIMEVKANLYSDEKPKSRNALMKQIRKKYGIDNNPGSTEAVPGGDSYKDRAHERRKKTGSDNPYEKTEVSTTEQSIPATNKGFKMLSKMGWSSGKALGSGSTGGAGILEPITVDLKSDRAGLGSSQIIPSQPHHTSIKPLQNKAKRLAITKKRFQDAGETDVMDVDDKD